MPCTSKNFFNRLSSLIHDAMYVTAASDKQQCDGLRPAHKKSPPNSKRVWRDASSVPHLCMTIQPTRKLRFFYSVGLSCLWYIKIEPTNCDFHFTSSSALRLSVWLFDDMLFCSISGNYECSFTYCKNSGVFDQYLIPQFSKFHSSM